MSLGSWFRDYVYIPLGGNRQGEWKTYRNLAVVWFLTGIWHGASWTFIAWGVYYGVFIMLERAFLGKWLKAMPSWLSLSFTLFVVIIGWVFFRADDFPYAIAYLQTMFGLHGGPLFDQQALYYLVQYGVVLLVAIIAATPIPRIVVGKFLSQELDDTKTTATRRIVGLVRVSGVLVLFFLSISYIVSSTFNPFIYFRF